MSKLRISPDLSLPEDVVTSTTVVYGGKGMGKTNLASVLIEELTKARLRWCLLDPMGVSWGLRHSADGKGPGVECVILGGAHGDIPIEPTGGAIVADLVVDENVNTIIDFSRKANGQMWTKSERIRFVTDYATRLFERQGELLDGNRRREPLLQILDEAARYIPQMIPAGSPDLAKCVGAWEQICEEGRNIGLGVAFITQRSARMNKSVSELADVMFAFRTIGPNSLEAVMDWLGEHVPKTRVRELAEKVRSLDVGQALVVSPGWLKVEKIAQIRQRETFDSSATPKAGQRTTRVTGAGAKPDLGKYQSRMAATIERVKADDPKALRAENAALRKQLAAAPSKERVVERTVVDERATARAIAAAVKPYREKESLVQRQLMLTTTALRKFVDAFEPLANAGGTTVTVELPKIEAEAPRGTVSVTQRPADLPRRSVSSAPATVTEGITRPQQRVLDTIAQFEVLGVDRPTRGNIGVFMGVSSTTGGFKNNLSALRTAGYIEYPADNFVALTEAGRAIASAADAPQSLSEIHSRWLERVTNPQARILHMVLDNHPDEVSRVDIASALGVSHTTGGFKNNLSALRSLGLIDYPRDGMVAATPLMYPRGLR